MLNIAHFQEIDSGNQTHARSRFRVRHSPFAYEQNSPFARLPFWDNSVGCTYPEKSFDGTSDVSRKKQNLDPKTFLATIGEGRRAVAFSKREVIFAQGDAADAIFYIQQGKVQLSVVSKIGREATLGILNERQFFGEGALAGQSLRMGSAKLYGVRTAAH